MPGIDKARRIAEHELFKDSLAVIEKYERDRIYCRHDMAHFIDVARVGMLLICERGYDIPADVMYGAALTHDLGRADEYENGTPHHQAGVAIAEKILKDTGYSIGEAKQIAEAIAVHRMEGNSSPLAEVLYEADKKSRPCYACQARETCNWPDEKKNLSIVI